MARTAVLLMDLQRDFLSDVDARMPVDRLDAQAVIRAANAVLDRQVLPDALPLLVVNRFPASARLGNFFRRQAAIVGSPGAEIDDRIHDPGGVKRIAKSSSSAFDNPELETFLKANGVQALFVLGVFAEGCVRATVADARRLGYPVTVPLDAIGSNARWKRLFAQWHMRRTGATLIPSLFGSAQGR